MVRVELRERQVWVDGKRRFLYGGTMQYFRIPRRLWAPGIRKLKEAHLNFLDIYIPWVWHEPEEGKFDFTGETHPERDLVGFCRMVREAGLWLVVRAGPNIYAEYDNFGFPHWLTEDPEVMQVAEDGRRWHVVSFNHPRHLEAVSRWYRAVYGALAPFLGDNVVANQVDNETGLLLLDGFISPTPLFRDYNPATLEMFHRWLPRRFGSVEEMNRQLGTRVKSWGEFVPRPRLPWRRLRSEVANFGEVMVWQEFLEDWVVDYLEALRGMMVDLGVPGPYLLNEPATVFSPVNPGKKSRVAPVGYDLYPKVVGGDSHTFDQPFLACFASKMFANYSGDGPVFSPETGAGWFNPFTRVSPEQTVQLVGMEMAHSTRFINFYVLHDCVETDGTRYCWDTCIDLEGKTGPRHEAIRRLGEFIESREDLLLSSEEVDDPIAVAHYFPNHRMFSSDPFVQAADFAFHGVFGLLHDAGWNPRVVDLETATPEALQGQRALVVMSKGHMDPATLAKLRDYVHGGGTLIVYPQAPTRDLLGHPLEGARELFPDPLGRRVVSGLTPSAMNLILTVALWRGLRRWRIPSRWQRFTIDGMEQTFPPMSYFLGRRVALTYPGGRFQGGPVTHYGSPPMGAETTLRRGRRCAGYTHRVGQGRVHLVGNLLGGTHACSQYYHAPEPLRAGQRAYATWLLQPTGLRPAARADVPVETTLRSSPEGPLLFLINRGPARRGNVNLGDPGALGLRGRVRLEPLFAWRPAPAGPWNAEAGGAIPFQVGKDDLQILRVESAK
ncbi:MAG: beta-galactosidase [Euryarchaeota archaeon]|nr:beta-galactosidase [Euryarchaeota archaeon]